MDEFDQVEKTLVSTELVAKIEELKFVLKEACEIIKAEFPVSESLLASLSFICKKDTYPLVAKTEERTAPALK